MSYTPTIRYAPDTPDNREITRRLKAAAAQPTILSRCTADYVSSFTRLGIEPTAATHLAVRVFDAIKHEPTLADIEHKVHDLFAQTTVGQEPFLHTIDTSMTGRADIIYDQIAPHFKGITRRVVDYGAGDGQISQRIRDRLKLTVDAYDVNPFDSPATAIVVHKFDGKRLPAPNSHYQAALLTNVMHHEKNNQQIIDELTRTVTERLVIIETVPVGNTPEEIQQDAERTFVNDCFWNRLLHIANIPVPGTYETPQGWIDRIEPLGWDCVHSENLGVDQPTIADTHHLLVFKRNNGAL
jgi:hypothetical protein